MNPPTPFMEPTYLSGGNHTTPFGVSMVKIEVMTVYKYADNDLGYIKENVFIEGYKSRKGWYENSDDAVADKPTAAPKKKAGRPRKVH